MVYPFTHHTENIRNHYLYLNILYDIPLLSPGEQYLIKLPHFPERSISPMPTISLLFACTKNRISPLAKFFAGMTSFLLPVIHRVVTQAWPSTAK